MPANTPILIDQTQTNLWDVFVENHPFGWICHLSGWKRVLENSFPHMKGHFLALFDDNNTSIRAGLPIFEVKSQLTGKRFVSIPFATLCDPLISNNNEMKILLEAAKDLAKRASASHIEIRARASSELIENNAELGRVDGFTQHFLLLDGDSESLMKSFHRTCVRKNIRKNERTNLKVRVAEENKDVESFYTLYAGTRKFNGLPALPLHFVKSIFGEFLSTGNIVLLMAELDTKPIAAMVLYKFKNRVSAEFLGWDRTFIDAHPSVFLYWEAIKMAQKEGYGIFDFGRTAINNKGLMDFKGHWGTQTTGLPHFYYPIDAAKSAIERDRPLKRNLAGKVFGNIPDILYLPLSNFYYRYMS